MASHPSIPVLVAHTRQDTPDGYSGEQKIDLQFHVNSDYVSFSILQIVVEQLLGLF